MKESLSTKVRQTKMYLSLMSRQTKIKCIVVIAFAFISSFFASLWPVKLGELCTSISNGSIRTLAQGSPAILMLGLIYVVSEGITVARRVFLDWIIATHESELRGVSIEKLLKMPASYYSGCLSGEKTAQLNQGVVGFSKFIKIMCNDVFATVLTAACTFVQVFCNAPAIMVVIMAFYLAFTVIISFFQLRSQKGIREDILRQKNTLDGKICQSISNQELIRVMHAEKYEKKRLVPDIMNICRTEQSHHCIMGRYDSLKHSFKIAFLMILLGASIVLIANGEMSGGAVITVCLLFQQLVKPIDEVYRFMDEIQSSNINAKALIEVVAGPSDEIFDIQSSGEETSCDEIHVEDVVVINPKNERVAGYNSVTIPTKRVVALKGASGCGKTGLIRCLTRYYPHSQGKVSLFGRYQESYSQKELTDMLYYTPQVSFFIAGTVRENLVYGLDREVSDEELVRVLRSVCLAGDEHGATAIRKDPMEALQVTISEKSEELSGGKKQLLLLARAFLRHPKLYVFDEITANLDSGTTSYVLSNIEAHARKIGAGIVYISHEQEVVDRCDYSIQLESKLKEDEDGRAAA